MKFCGVTSLAFGRIITALVCLTLGVTRSGAQAVDWKQIKSSPLRSVPPPTPKRVVLKNGMVLLLLEDHELPLIRGRAGVRGGTRDEPADKLGMLSIYGESWRTGGAKSRTGDELDDFLDARAATIETWGSFDATTVSWDCLKENFEDVLEITTELLKQPEFREDKVSLAKTQLHTGIARRNDESFGIASRESTKLAYGADSPYARTPEHATVDAVSREDLVKWHKAHMAPNNIVLGIVGDFDSQQMEARLRKQFEGWEKGVETPRARDSAKSPKPGVYFVEKPDVTASMIEMVDIGITRDNPDFYAVEVFNQFFGGSFSSRLFSNVRSKKGLAYMVSGRVGAEFDHPGVLRLSMGTKSATTAAAIDALTEEIDALKSRPATHEELTQAKDAILNSFIFRFDSKAKVLYEQILYEFYGYPADFLDRYRAGIQSVTEQDLARVAEKYLHKDKLAILVVGKAADFERPLKSFGPVTQLDISIPGAPTK